MQAAESRDPYGAALGAVRQFAEAGQFVPGEAIIVTELAAEVGLSPTPIREALACLAGQGLVERRRGRGYFYPALTAGEVIDLFELQLAYLHAALTLHPRGLSSLRKAAVAVDPLDDVQALFDSIIAQSANPALSLAYQRVKDRLGAVLRAERRQAGNSGQILAAMVSAIVDGQVPELLTLLAAHHDRRCVQVSTLSASLDQAFAPQGAGPSTDVEGSASTMAASAPAADMRRR